MILVLINWIWIGITSFLIGFAALEGLGKVTGRQEWKSLELYILMGLSVLTVYAQVFSLFSGVGSGANIWLGAACLLVFVLLFKQIKRYIDKLISDVHTWYRLIPMLAIVGLVLYITAGKTYHYDTDLYHAQAIRWIEEYGVVKGLGNLHNRFAYNSSFLCLQALFSLKFAVNQSLHSLNGFFTTVILCYGVLTLSFWKKERCKISDFFKIGLFMYFNYLETSLVVSSPGTDILTLCMVLYLSAKWAELLERHEKDPSEYGILCLLAVWTVTVKLSAGLLILLTIYPAVLLIRQKKGKQIALFLTAGVIFVFPFLIRNVLISGYLLYPYASLDLFSVDWKMAASVVADDSKEIMAWGRGMTRREDYSAPISVWFPKWYEGLSGILKGLFWGNIFCLIIFIIYLLGIFFKKKDEYGWGVLGTVCAAQLVMWLGTAPLIRYGMVYMLLLPAFFMGKVQRKLNCRILPWIICAGGIYCGISRMYQVADEFTDTYWKRPADYNWKEAVAYSWEGMEIYVPRGSDSIGYHYFPSTPGAARLESIELRTGELEDGFRLREEYRNLQFNSAGEVVNQ